MYEAWVSDNIPHNWDIDLDPVLTYMDIIAFLWIFKLGLALNIQLISP